MGPTLTGMALGQLYLLWGRPGQYLHASEAAAEGPDGHGGDLGDGAQFRANFL